MTGIEPAQRAFGKGGYAAKRGTHASLARDLLGIDAQALSRKSLCELIHPEAWAAHGVKIAQLMAGTMENFKSTLRVMRQDGRSAVLHCCFSLSGSPPAGWGCVLMVLDDRL